MPALSRCDTDMYAARPWGDKDPPPPRTAHAEDTDGVRSVPSPDSTPLGTCQGPSRRPRSAPWPGDTRPHSVPGRAAEDRLSPRGSRLGPAQAPGEQGGLRLCRPLLPFLGSHSFTWQPAVPAHPHPHAIPAALLTHSFLGEGAPAPRLPPSLPLLSAASGLGRVRSRRRKAQKLSRPRCHQVTTERRSVGVNTNLRSCRRR